MKNIYHEGKLINKAGVDRVVLSHVELKKINWPVFKKAITASSDIIYDAFRSANRTYYVTEGGDRLHYMTITDPEVMLILSFLFLHPFKFAVIYKVMTNPFLDFGTYPIWRLT